MLFWALLSIYVEHKMQRCMYPSYKVVFWAFVLPVFGSCVHADGASQGGLTTSVERDCSQFSFFSHWKDGV